MITRNILALAFAATTAPAALAAPQMFENPDAAVAAVISALEARDRDALVAVFGSENEDVILTDDPAENRETWGAFLTAYTEMHRVVVSETGVAELFIGRDQYPVPITLLQGDDGQWAFDAEGAREEILIRRIGENELDVIELMAGYVRVQRDFRRVDYDGDGVMEFAAHILSTPGTRDGLYWPPEEDTPDSPVGDFVARAAAGGFSIDGQDAEPEPYLGYYYRVLSRQGESAPGGAMEYMINGNMVAGHALIAFPTAYGETGVMTFMVSENGVVLEADLGEGTLDIASEIESFDPGEAWSPVE